MVCVFARKTSEPLASLVKKIDAETAKNSKAKMGSFVVYLTAGAIAAGVWLAGAMVSGPARYAAWVVAVATEVTAPVVATRRSAGLPLHLEHLPERLGLLVILVLGESIAAVAVGVQETHWERATVTVAVLGFVAAVSLWWTYFDLAGAAATHTLVERAGHRSTLLHDVYAYGHWPLTLGLAAAGVGLEGAILEGGQPTLTSGTRWLLCGGVALSLGALTAIQSGVAGSLRSGLPWPGIGVPLVLAAGLGGGGGERTQEQIEANVAALAKRLEQTPDDVSGWTMLGRSYSSLGKYAEASAAYKKASALKPDDADLLADYAFTLAMASDKKLAGEPAAIVARALKLDPENPKALELSGSVAYEANDFQLAIKHWQKLLTRTTPDSEIGRALTERIEEAKSRIKK